MTSCADISAGLESIPIPCTSDRDDCGMPTDFEYVRDSVAPDNLPVLQDAYGCGDSCLQGMEQCSGTCPCRGPSNDAFRTSADGEGHGAGAFECGPACACSLSACQNRASQHGLTVRCSLRKTDKGWAVFAMEDIRPGTVVCTYAGELLSNREADQRLLEYDKALDKPGHALLVIREILPSGNAVLRMNVDATREGNIARFMNHSCDGGCLGLEVVRRRGALLPAIAMVAKHTVHVGQELTFMYGPPNAGRPGQFNARRCLCGTPACLGFLPAEALHALE